MGVNLVSDINEEHRLRVSENRVPRRIFFILIRIILFYVK
jgi:hypothetical protein